MEEINRTAETVEAEVIGGEFQNYAEYKQEFDRIIHKTAEGFVEIGYMLRIADETHFIREAGYRNMEEFAKTEYGIDKGQASRFININKIFSVGGYSRVLQTRYQGMGVAKLGLMLTLPMSVNEELTQDFSKEEIKMIKEEVDEEKRISELEVLMEGEKEPQAELDTLLEKAVHQLGEEKPELFLPLWKLTMNYMQFGKSEGLIQELTEELAPCGEAVYSVRVQGTGRLMFSFKSREKTFKLIHVRQDEKEIHSVTDVLDILWRLAGEYPFGEGEDAWEAIYKKEFPKAVEDKTPKETAKKTPAKKESRVVKAKTEKIEKPVADTDSETVENSIPGQMSVEDYPGLLPEGYEKEKVAPVQQEEKLKNVIKTGTEADSRAEAGGTLTEENTIEEAGIRENEEKEAVKEPDEAAGLTGMSVPDPVWTQETPQDARTVMVTEIRHSAQNIEKLIADNAFLVDVEKIKKLELALEYSERLKDSITDLIEMIKKEAYQE